MIKKKKNVKCTQFVLESQKKIIQTTSRAQKLITRLGGILK